MPFTGFESQILEVFDNKVKSDTTGNAYQDFLKEIDAIVVRHALKVTQGNQTKAAQLLGVNRGTFRKKMSLLEGETQTESKTQTQAETSLV